MRRSLVLVGVMAVALSIGGAPPAPSHAQSSTTLSPEQVVAVRKSLMDLQQGVLGAMKGAVDAKADVKPLTAGAKGLVQSSKEIAALFPPGTDKVGDTKALPAVWSDPTGLAKDASDLTAAAEKLVQLADANDKDGFATQFAAVGRTCGACHRTFKQKDN